MRDELQNPSKPRSRLALLLGLGRRNAFFLCLLLDRGNRVAAGEPAVEIDVGAALRAERPEPLGRRLAADRALSRAGNRVGHAPDIGTAGAEGKSGLVEIGRASCRER